MYLCLIRLFFGLFSARENKPKNNLIRLSTRGLGYLINLSFFALPTLVEGFFPFEKIWQDLVLCCHEPCCMYQ